MLDVFEVLRIVTLELLHEFNDSRIFGFQWFWLLRRFLKLLVRLLSLISLKFVVFDYSIKDTPEYVQFKNFRVVLWWRYSHKLLDKLLPALAAVSVDFDLAGTVQVIL